MKKIIIPLLLVFTFVFQACEDNKPVTVSKFSTQYEVYYVGETIEFLNESFAANSYLWDFGDGRTSSRENVSLSYDEPGIYEVALHAYGTYNDDVTYLTIEIIRSTDLDILVMYYETGDADIDPPVVDARIDLYTTENDYLNFTNIFLNGYTDNSGLILFQNLNPVTYWIDAYLESEQGGYYSNELLGNTTDPLVADQVNYYSIFVEYFGEISKDGRKLYKVKKIEPRNPNSRTGNGKPENIYRNK